MDYIHVRYASLGFYMVKPRCRKESFEYVHGVGSDDRDALIELHDRLREKIAGAKSVRYPKPIECSDAQRVVYSDHTTLQYSIYPTSRDNVKYYDAPIADSEVSQ